MGWPDDRNRSYDARDLTAFAQLAACASLSEAARRGGLPKASLSRSLARLEAAAGTPLFERSPRGLRLTTMGAALLPAAEAATAALREADATLRCAADEPRGRLRVAASAGVTQAIVAPTIARLRRRHPGIRVQLTIDAEGPNPIAEELDVVVQFGRPRTSELITRRIAEFDLGLYVARDLAAAIDVDDVAQVEGLGRIVVAVPGMPECWQLRHRDQAERTLTLESEPTVTVDEPVVVVELLRAAMGVALLPPPMVAPLLASGELMVALPSWRGPTAQVFVSTPPKRKSVATVRAFLDEFMATVEQRRSALAGRGAG